MTERRRKALFALVHSPLVGPSTWSLVAEELVGRGEPVVVPAYGRRDDEAARYWERQRDEVVSQVSARGRGEVVLVGHSGAGPLLPAIGEALGGRLGRAVGGYLHVDAGVPEGGASRLELLERELPGAAGELRELLAAGGRFPTWSDEDLREEIPDAASRRRVLSELRPRPLAFWEERLPVVEGWPDAPCSYLQLSAGYDGAAERARELGWSVRRLPGGHFHMLVDPRAVAEEILRAPGYPTPAAG